jgi:hypothetical protein
MKTKERESFIMYKSFYEPISGLPDEVLGRLLRAIFNYQISGVEPDKTSDVYMIFLFFKNQFRLDNIKYDKTCEKNSKNGSLGGRPKKPKETQRNPTVSEEPKKADKDNGKDKEKEKDNEINDTLNFEKFWSIYPKKKAKADAEKAWKSLKIDETLFNLIIGGLKKQIESSDWKKDGGKYIPHPATWLRARRWEDDVQDYPDDEEVILPKPVKLTPEQEEYNRNFFIIK